MDTRKLDKEQQKTGWMVSGSVMEKDSLSSSEQYSLLQKWAVTNIMSWFNNIPVCHQCWMRSPSCRNELASELPSEMSTARAILSFHDIQENNQGEQWGKVTMSIIDLYDVFPISDLFIDFYIWMKTTDVGIGVPGVVVWPSSKNYIGDICKKIPHSL